MTKQKVLLAGVALMLACAALAVYAYIAYLNVHRTIIDGSDNQMIEVEEPVETGDRLNYAGFLTLLDVHGIPFEEGDKRPVVEHLLSVGSRDVWIDSEVLSVFQYDSRVAMQRDAGFILPNGLGISQPDMETRISFRQVPRWFKDGRIIVLYIGRDGDIVNLLTEILGDYFAGGSME